MEGDALRIPHTNLFNLLVSLYTQVKKMKIAKCKLVSQSPYSQGKYHQTEKKSKELPKDYESRTWKQKCHINKDGYVIIPPMAFANSIKEAATYMSISIPGQGKSKYTKNFHAGILVPKPLVLDMHIDEIKSEWVFVPSDGRRGGTTRVSKCFPLIESWNGTVEYYIMDDIITIDIFERVLKAAGQLIGIGRFRPKNWGYYGRYSVEGIKWEEQSL